MVRSPQVLAWTPVVAFGLVALLFVGVSLSRVGSPFNLEWMEGGMAEHTERLARGEALYTEPGLEWTPFLYPPGFPLATATLLSWIPDARVAGRVVSLLSTLLSAFLAAWAVRRRTANAPASITAGLLFLATYSASGFWFDLNRVDSMSLALLAAATVLLLTPGTGPAALELLRGAGAGALLTGAILTKQTALAVSLALLIAAARPARTRALACAASLTLLTAGTVLWLQAGSAGRFWLYTVSLPAAHGAPLAVLAASAGELVRGLPVVALAAILLPLAPSSLRRRLLDGWALPALAALAACLWARAHTGSYLNAFIPVHWFAAVLGGLLWARIGELQAAAPAAGLLRPAAGAMALQAALLLFDPRTPLPDPATGARTDELVAMLRGAPRAVFFPDRPDIVRRAGHPIHAHTMALADLRKAGLPGLPAPDPGQALHRRTFSALVLRPAQVSDAVRQNYRLSPRLTEAVMAVPRPPTGWSPPLLQGWRVRDESPADGE